MTDWNELSARAGVACHDLVGWMMWDPRAIAGFEALGVPNGTGWVVAWRLASLGDVSPAAAAATTYSISTAIVDAVMNLYLDATDPESILAVRDDAVEPGLAEVSPELPSRLGELATPLWRGVDAVHHGARPMFAAHRAAPRPDDVGSCLSAWLAANCLRELRGDNHWALCAAEDLDDVEVGLLHSAMIDVEEYGGEEWIARSRGADDDAVAAGWARLEAKGLADAGALNDDGRRFRRDLETRTDALTAPAWTAVGLEATTAFCELVEPHHDAFVARIDATAGPRWMPAVRVTNRPTAR
ncbi:SCO6745 family protein [Ilumatobacter sp.]|uniref:SCO6745 family protein n=1 Tax=Ilumatobacter sp. TaxID=1967498 RepID=UPI003AF6E843